MTKTAQDLSNHTDWITDWTCKSFTCNLAWNGGETEIIQIHSILSMSVVDTVDPTDPACYFKLAMEQNMASAVVQLILQTAG